MKHRLPLIVLSALFILSGILAAGRVLNAAFEGASPAVDPDGAEAAPGGGMPGWPVPHHEPGHPSRAAGYTTQVTRLNTEGIGETVQLTGLDALLADGVIDDPLAGNYGLVNLDKILVGRGGEIATFSAISGTAFITVPELISGSEMTLPGTVAGVAAGDLNLDGFAEQIAAWIDADSTINLAIGELPGSAARTTSAPAAVAHNDGRIDLLVRGFDYALWHRHYDGSAWGEWENSAGGHLLSAPAVASRGLGSFDAFAVGLDNLIYRRHWHGAAWTGDWELVDDASYGLVASQMPNPTWPLPADVDAPEAVPRQGTTESELFRRGPHNTLRWRHFDGSAWGAWQDLGGIITSAPSAVSLGEHHVQVFARGVDQGLWTLVYDSEGWGRWEPMAMPSGISAASAPTAVSVPGSNEFTVYVRGSDGALWQIEYDESGWGAWSDALGGDLASRVGVAAWAGGTELFARELDGTLLHNNFDGFVWSGWQPFGGLKACCQVTDTGASAPTSLDVQTGFFSGDGRPQILLAFNDAQYDIHVQIYDVENGFQARLRAGHDFSGGYPGFSPDMIKAVAGDFDLDGTDEIAVVFRSFPRSRYGVVLLDVVVEADGDWSIELKHFLYKPIGLPPNVQLLFCLIGACDVIDARIFDQDIVAGDFDGDADEELAITTLTALRFRANYLPAYCPLPLLSCYGQTWAHTRQIIDVPSLDAAEEVFFENVMWALRNPAASDFPTEPCWGCTELEAGNLDGDLSNGVEIIATVSGSPSWGPARTMMVFNATPVVSPTEGLKLTQRAMRSFGPLLPSGQDALVVGDFNRDLKDEIGLIYDVFPLQTLDVARYVVDEDPDSGIEQVAAYSALGIISGVEPAAGGFTGESLRVGPPTYRLQRLVGDMIAFVNQPPKHTDILDGVLYDVNGGDSDTYAAYENEQSQSTEMSIQVQRGWGLAAGMEVVVGNPTGTHVRSSLEGTYGQNFENTTTRFSEVQFGSETQAIGDDLVYYTGKDLEVWEYPVYKDEDDTPDGRLMVVFPRPMAGNTGTQKYYNNGASCDFWYAPDHHIRNVWSYAKDITQLRDYDPAKEPLYPGETWEMGPSSRSFFISWSKVAEEQRASSVTMGVSSLFEAQIGGDSVTVEASPFGVGVSYEVFLPSLKVCVESSYSQGTFSTHTLVGSEETTMRAQLGAIPQPSPGAYAYEVTPYLYWARGGYLVLDYLTMPNMGTSFWSKYDKADPAFILPWQDGQCPGKERFSKDIVVNPPFAGIGETVMISATVRNFSNHSANNVKVRFCHGDPGPACNPTNTDVYIGEKTIPTLLARDRITVRQTWEASGSGEQRLYAVIDPEGQIAEMHDETTNPEYNNNVAFGVLAMGDSGFVDPGAQVVFDYQFLTFTDTQGIASNVFVPTAVMTATARFELTPLPPSVAASTTATRRGFTLTAYQGGEDRDHPWDLRFDPAPGAVVLRYSDQDVAGLDENELILGRKKQDGTWEDAACGAYQRYPEQNWMLVPICRTGVFALLEQRTEVYLPLVLK